MADKIFEYTDVTIEDVNFRIRSEWRVGWQGGPDTIVTAVAVNGKLSGTAGPIEGKLDKVATFREPQRSELTVILKQQQASILAQVEAQEQGQPETQPYPDPEPEALPEEGETPPPSDGENLANEDTSASTEGGTTGASEPTNASQETQAETTAGTEETTNPNIDGAGNAQSNALLSQPMLREDG